MARIRSRRAPRERADWPLSVEEELRVGVDLSRYTGKLARLYARWAPYYLKPGPEHDPERAVRDLTFARRLERR